MQSWTATLHEVECPVCGMKRDDARPDATFDPVVAALSGTVSVEHNSMSSGALHSAVNALRFPRGSVRTLQRHARMAGLEMNC